MQPPSSVRAAVLFGAGASRFANFPAVDYFFEQALPRGGAIDELCSQLARKISIHEGNQQELKWPAFNAEKLFGWLEVLDKAQAIQGTDGNTRAVIVSNNRGLEMRADELISSLRGEIVKAYARDLDPQTLKSAPHNDLFKILDTVIPDTDSLHIFTTNYDGVLEQLFQFWRDGNSPIFKQFRIVTGFSSDRPGRWQAELFDEKPIPGVRLIKLAKLHGSVTWKKDANGRPVETGWSMPTPHDTLLYFGYKSVPDEEPFVTLHRLLKTTLLKYDFLIAIGFRFGDPYIYELFDIALRANPKLRVICCLTRSPEPDSAVGRMTAQFPNRIRLLFGSDGNPVPFGQPAFEQSLNLLLTQLASQ